MSKYCILKMIQVKILMLLSFTILFTTQLGCSGSLKSKVIESASTSRPSTSSEQGLPTANNNNNANNNTNNSTSNNTNAGKVNQNCQVSTATSGVVTVLHSRSQTFFERNEVVSPSTCQSQMRLCNNGYLSGSYIAAYCKVKTNSDTGSGTGTGMNSGNGGNTGSGTAVSTSTSTTSTTSTTSSTLPTSGSIINSNGPDIITQQPTVVTVATHTNRSPYSSIELVNKLYDGRTSESEGLDADISEDCKYVVFSSKTNYLIQNPVGNIFNDVYVRDMTVGKTFQISSALDGKMNDGNSGAPAISSNGQRIAFMSDATNLIDGDNNGHGDIFYIDWKYGGPIKLASESKDHVQGNGNSYSPALSGDGKFIAFTSSANNLISNSSAEVYDLIYLKNLDTGELILITRGIDGKPVNGDSKDTSISSDGKVLAFSSTASNLALYDQNRLADIFIYRNGKVELVSKNIYGKAASGISVYPKLNAAGNLLAFESTAQDMVPNDSFVYGGIFIKHLDQGGELEQLSLTYDKQQPNGSITLIDFSADGRFVVFSSSASNIVENDRNNLEDMFIYDRLTKSVSMVSVTATGALVDGASREAKISADGTHMVLGSRATNLIAEKVNPFQQNLYWLKP